MRSKFDEQLRLLNQEMMYMGTMIEDSIQKAIEALIAQNAQLAEKIMNSDSDVDHEQKKIENICFNLLMQQQPVARDLRVISAAMKMVTDMERIGDHAADISEITIMLSKEPYVLNLDDIKKMASETVIMLIRSIEAYVEKDMNKAQEVIRHDDIVDDLFDKNKADIIELIRHDPEKGEQAADMLMVAKYFDKMSVKTPTQETPIQSLSGGNQQKVLLAKWMFADPDILILDEPTAVLTPQETEKLFSVIRNMKADGKAVIIITHKLHEVMSLSDKVAVLRKGQYIGTVNTSETNPQALTDMMVGHAVTLNIDRPRYENPVPRLTLQDVTCYDNEGVVRLDHVSFTAMGGEILGVAGIAGSGQRELLESIAGLYPVAEGSSIRYTPEGAPESELVGKTPMQIKKSGVALAFVPEDRLGMGLVGSMGMTGNMMLRSWRKGHSIFLDRKNPEALAQRIWQELEVVTPSTSFPVRRMSGGNVQKVLVGREIAQEPSVLMTAYAVRGLDINTSYTIYNLLTEQKMKGVAVVYVGEDLDVLLELCDRIVVLCGGQVSGVVDGRTTNKMEVGALMTRAGGGKADE